MDSRKIKYFWIRSISLRGSDKCWSNSSITECLLPPRNSSNTTLPRRRWLYVLISSPWWKISLFTCIKKRVTAHIVSPDKLMIPVAPAMIVNKKNSEKQIEWLKNGDWWSKTPLRWQHSSTKNIKVKSLRTEGKWMCKFKKNLKLELV